MSEYIYGKNSVREAINSNKEIIKLYIANATEFVQMAQNKKIPYEICNNKDLNRFANNHQGIVAEVKQYKYVKLEEITSSARKEYPLIVVLDGLEDPHNLGAIIRTCDASGVDGIIIPKNRSVGLNATVSRVSCGAIEYVKVCEVTNLTQTLEKLKKMGYWVVAAELTNKSVNFQKQRFDMPIALVVGSEGKGISRLVIEHSDFVVKIPMYGHVNSLNASVSCSLLIYEIIKYRKE